MTLIWGNQFRLLLRFTMFLIHKMPLGNFFTLFVWRGFAPSELFWEIGPWTRPPALNLSIKGSHLVKEMVSTNKNRKLTNIFFLQILAQVSEDDPKAPALDVVLSSKK